MRWFLNPILIIIAISIINHSYWSYVHQLSYHKSAINPIKSLFFLVIYHHLGGPTLKEPSNAACQVGLSYCALRAMLTGVKQAAFFRNTQKSF